MITTEMKYDLKIAVLSLNYPVAYRPSATEAQSFWQGSEDERTFFVRQSDNLTEHQYVLVMPTSDGRSEGMWFDREYDPLGGHRGWTVESRYLTVADLNPQPEVESEPQPDRVPVGTRVEVVKAAYATAHIGKSGVIESNTDTMSFDGEPHPYRVKMDDETEDLYVAEVKVIEEPEQGYAVGDRVMVIYPEAPEWNGPATVERVGFDSTYVVKPDGLARSGGFKPEHLRPLIPYPSDAELDAAGIVAEAELAEAVADEVDELAGAFPLSPAAANDEILRLRTAVNERAAERDSLQARVERLAADRDRAQREASQAYLRHTADIARIGEVLIEQAELRDWCEEYDRVIEELNGDLTISLPVREHEYEVTLRVEYLVTKTVTAESEDAAGEKAEEEYESSDLNFETPQDFTIVSVEPAS